MKNLIFEPKNGKVLINRYEDGISLGKIEPFDSLGLKFSCISLEDASGQCGLYLYSANDVYIAYDKEEIYILKEDNLLKICCYYEDSSIGLTGARLINIQTVNKNDYRFCFM